MPRKNPSNFRIAARNIFLTYPPQCSLSEQEALEQIKNLNFNSLTLKYLRVARENHQDGQSYLRCLLQFAGIFQTQNRRFFGLRSTNGSTSFHPSIEGAKSRSAVKSFVLDGADDFVEWELRSDGGGKKKSVGGSGKLADVYSAALKKEDKAAALAVIREGDPRGFVLNFDKITSNLDLIFEKSKMIVAGLARECSCME
ncbi:replication-associated protein [Phtheirospermum japonicum]|uniref:Replication-associated protein n=1 Tax=Phtheirospermum japonicum TaxID=374723 RepID=A0A830C8Z2_9LAMI|nr:replication-associated protein [Phtheirospermum japonicum]